MSENASIYQSPYSSQYRYRRRWVPKGVALLAVLFVVGLLGACHSPSPSFAEIAVPVDAEGFVWRADGASVFSDASVGSITSVVSATNVAGASGIARVTRVATVASDARVASVNRATTGASVNGVAGVSSWKGMPGQDWTRAQQQAMVLNTF